jgi:Ser/Thr protein kinase RdoA (MazF antagonist)
MHSEIKQIVQSKYKVIPTDIHLIRDMIGSVYKIQTSDLSYILKVYKRNTEIDVDYVIQVMDYLSKQGCPLPKIYKNIDNELITLVNQQYCVLFEFIEGETVKVTSHHPLILKTLNHILKEIQTFPITHSRKTSDFYIQRFIKQLKAIQYDSSKIKVLEQIGMSLFQQLSTIENEFIHGDFHTGNMILKNHLVYLFDFDACGDFHKEIDLMTICDKTHFNHLKEEDIHQSLIELRKYSSLNILDQYRLLAFIPIRHFEIIGTIIDAQGLESLSTDFCNQQFNWIQSFFNYYTSIQQKSLV